MLTARPAHALAKLILPLGALLAALLTALAARSDLGRGYHCWDVVLDMTVGLTFVFAGLGLRGDGSTRVLLSAVGVGWLVASVWPAWGGLHQGLLLLALASSGGLRRWGLSAVVVAALPVAAGMLLEQVVALLFSLVAVLLLVTCWPLSRRARTSAAAAVLVGLCLAGRWWVAQTWPSWGDPQTPLTVYEIGLLLVALAVSVASRSGAGTATRLTGRLLAGVDATGVEGLSAVLAQTLGDPALRVLPPEAPYGTARALPVEDGGQLVAVVSYRSAALDEPSTAASVATAVRLTLAHDTLRREQECQLAQLEAARARIVAATDRQRALAAAALREDVEALNRVGRHTAAVVAPGMAYDMGRLREALVVVTSELAAAGRAILGLVEGVPPADLGGGRLMIELEALARRAPVSVRILATEDVAADAATEAVVYYVCAEALTNAAKHADALEVVIDVQRVPDGLAVSVRDDGRGGADRSGSGLQGLDDRVAAAGGRFRVASSPGAGTLIVATLPLN